MEKQPELLVVEGGKLRKPLRHSRGKALAPDLTGMEDVDDVIRVVDEAKEHSDIESGPYLSDPNLKIEEGIIGALPEDPENVIGRRRIQKRRWDVAKREREAQEAKGGIPDNLVPFKR